MTMTNSSNPPTILVIDDNEVIRSILLSLLARAGYRVLQAADGDKGIALYRDHQDVVSLVLLDMQMPHRNGMETLKELRKINLAVCCLLMTGDERKDEVLQAEVAGVLAKPFSHASLFMALERAGVPPVQAAATPKTKQ
jgi:CheY-like chemotaxis protein